MEFKNQMQLINAYFGDTLLDVIEHELANSRGNRFDVGVGYAQYLSGATFARFGKALETWLEGDEQRRFRIFIGDHRHFLDTSRERTKKIRASTLVAANLIKFARSVEERMEVVFLHRLHAKFYTMWLQEGSGDRLVWAIAGSSNLTDAALEENNIELDIYLEPGDPGLQAIQRSLSTVIGRLYHDGDSWGVLHDALDALTAKSRWENEKLCYVEACAAETEAEIELEEQRHEEERARQDSDRRLGIFGTD